MTYFVLFLAATLFAVGDAYEAQCGQMATKSCLQDTQQWDSIRATDAEDCRLGCMEFAQVHGDEGCCEWDARYSSCHYNFRASTSNTGTHGGDKKATTCTTDAYHDRTQVDVVCAQKYYLKGFDGMPNKEDCQKKCEWYAPNCHTFCHSSNNPEWDCLLYTACDEVQDQLHGHWADNYECYERPGAKAASMLTAVTQPETVDPFIHIFAAIGLLFGVFFLYRRCVAPKSVETTTFATLETTVSEL